MSFPIFTELAKVVGTQRMLELCHMYIDSQKRSRSDSCECICPGADQASCALDASGQRFWADCSGVPPPSWRQTTPTRVPSPVPPMAPLRHKRTQFNSPALAPSPPKVERMADLQALILAPTD